MPGKINNVVMVLKRPPGKVFVDILHTAQSRFDKILEIIHIRKKNFGKLHNQGYVILLIDQLAIVIFVQSNLAIRN